MAVHAGTSCPGDIFFNCMGCHCNDWNVLIVVRQIKSTTIRHFILTGIAEKRSNKAYYKHLIRQIK